MAQFIKQALTSKWLWFVQEYEVVKNKRLKNFILNGGLK
jgi:hypothetical protein